MRSPSLQSWSDFESPSEHITDIRESCEGTDDFSVVGGGSQCYRPDLVEVPSMRAPEVRRNP